ncbi:hypothetical protein Cdeb_03400 [Caldibacillus debilis GB1]|uniref:Uncharacterized protein n=1 Tax=Caldibacillus debilis GB1 TaxID=1339248 RepID=A0A420VD84_9BACI|nr:hypothetical protein Cdeb_03400 [Caldibacillus debilis GB1]
MVSGEFYSGYIGDFIIGFNNPKTERARIEGIRHQLMEYFKEYMR